MAYKDPEEQREYQREYRIKNGEKYKEYQKEYQKQYYQQNKEKIIANRRKYQQNNKDKVSEWHRKFRNTHKEYNTKRLIKITTERNNESRLVAYNSNQLWTPEEIVILKKMRSNGNTYKEIASHLGRSIASINAMITRLRKNGDPFNGNPVDI